LTNFPPQKFKLQWRPTWAIIDFLKASIVLYVFANYWCYFITLLTITEI